MELIKPKKIFLRDHLELDEKWVHQQIADDPGILGLGDLVLRDRERIQPKAGRLDLLLQDPETDRRYEVEVQLGKTDERHIIRTIEYWDIEKKRYPQYDHCAVIVAEDVTSRFLNVISLFNGSIPIIAVQMTALQIENKVGLFFTTVLDETARGMVDEDEDVAEEVDRSYWENRGTRKTVALSDEAMEILRQFDSGLSPKYNKFYIGLQKDSKPCNFVVFRAMKGSLRVEPRIRRSEEVDAILEDAGFDVMPYNSRGGRYRLNISSTDFKERGETLKEIIGRAYRQQME